MVGTTKKADQQQNAYHFPIQQTENEWKEYGNFEGVVWSQKFQKFALNHCNPANSDFGDRMVQSRHHKNSLLRAFPFMNFFQENTAGNQLPTAAKEDYAVLSTTCSHFQNYLQMFFKFWRNSHGRTVLGKNVYSLVNRYNFASLPPISLIFKLETR